ncbi:MAG TPA: alpha/beta fold hydrolase [Vicinamibacterales bacterium]|jgi:pimeloyl-ACP methyl ester carboxylesterase
MQPFYFGSSHQQLFGVYDAPARGASANAAVVLCQPIGHEYLRAHRAFRNLGAALAERGFHVLRFDYFGSGDSGGDGGETTRDRCLADLAVAIDELKDMSGVTRVSLVGLRLGATFAALAAGKRPDIDRLVLWDPVVDGTRYLADLEGLQRRWLEDRMGDAARLPDAQSELIGFPMTADARTQLGDTRLMPLQTIRAKSIALFVSEESPYQPLRQALEASGRPFTYALIPGAGHWNQGELVHEMLLPHAMVRAIAGAMAG